MNRTDRLYAIVEELRAASPRPLSAARLAEHFEVSVRTIERDIDALQQAGVPVYAEPGRTGGYALDASRTLPPLNFSAAEAAAIAVALSSHEPVPLAQSARSALTKVMGALSEADARAARELGGRVWVAADEPRSPVPRAIEQAIIERRVLRLEYEDRHGQASDRVVEPVAVLGLAPSWYLSAWCRLREDLRMFRLDRIRAAYLTREIAPERNLPPVDLGDLQVRPVIE